MPKHQHPHWIFSKFILCAKKLFFSLGNQAEWYFPLLKKEYMDKWCLANARYKTFSKIKQTDILASSGYFSHRKLKQLFCFTPSWYKNRKMLHISPWYKSRVDLKITWQYFMCYQVACSKVTHFYIFKLIQTLYPWSTFGTNMLLPWFILIPIQSGRLTIIRLWMTGCHALSLLLLARSTKSIFWSAIYLYNCGFFVSISSNYSCFSACHFSGMLHKHYCSGKLPLLFLGYRIRINVYSIVIWWHCDKIWMLTHSGRYCARQVIADSS